MGLHFILLPLVFVLGALWLIMHYGVQFRRSTVSSKEDVTTMAELAALADRLQGRIDSLERLMDVSQPQWRRPS